MKKLILISIAISISLRIWAIDAPISPQTMQNQLGHGFDVSWAEFKVKIEGYGVDEVLAMKAKGFQTARIRTALPADSTLFSYLDRCINDCLNNDIIPIIAHNAGIFEANPSAENLQADIQWWDTIAKRYSDYSHKLLFNINIEWTDVAGKDSAIVNNYYRQITPVIRSSNPTRILIYSPIKISAPEYLSQMQIPASAGQYVMAEWHFYAAGPTKDPTNKKYWTTGTAEQKKLIYDEVKIAVDWQTQTGIPTWVGAWMAGNYNDGNDYTAAEQVVFASFMTHVLDSVEIPWAINTIDKFYDYTNNCWRDSMLVVIEALQANTASINTVANNSISYKANTLFFNTEAEREIRIFNLSGNLVFITNTKSNNYCLSNALLQGIYIVSVSENKRQVYRQKIWLK